MTNEDITKELTDLKITIQGYSARVDAQNIITNNRLQTIDEKLCKQNGRVGKLEERMTPLENHVKNTEALPNKIRQLEDSNLSNKSIRKFMMYMFASGMTLGAAIISLLKLILG